MFKGYDPDKKPPYKEIVYYVIGDNILKTTYTVSRGYADSISVTSFSERVEDVPLNVKVEVLNENK